MMRILTRVTYGAFILASSAIPAMPGLAAQKLMRPVSPPGLQKVLSWLPEDTETIAVATGPLTVPRGSEPDGDESKAISDRDLSEFFESIPLGWFGFKNQLLVPHFGQRQVLLAMEGARHFRPPSGLGQTRFEGCSIAILADDWDEDIDSFIKENREALLRVEHFEGQAIAVFREELENDTWTFFLTFPNKRTLVVATDHEYLREVLARMHGKNANRALANDLPEWKFARTDLPFWGLRHFDRTQAGKDSTSPFGGHIFAEAADHQAIGLTFAYDPSKGNIATITYLSGDASIAKTPDVTLLSMRHSPEAADLEIKYSELAPGVVQATYSFKSLGSAQFFFFVFEGMLGHALFI